MMLTVKWIASNGEEMIYEAINGVSFTPADNQRSDPRKATISFDMNGGSFCTLDSGRVYVMNANGRTVGDYSLVKEVA